MNTSILCEDKADMEQQLCWALHYASELLKELTVFYSGNIGIDVYPKRHVMGWSVCADLTVNGELCCHYDPADLCFLELNELILQRLIKMREENNE